MYSSLGSLGLHQVWANGQNAYYNQNPIFVGKSIINPASPLSLMSFNSSSDEEEPKGAGPARETPATFLYAARITRKPDYGWLPIMKKKRSYKFRRNAFEFLEFLSEKTQQDICNRWELWAGKYDLGNEGQWLQSYFKTCQLQVLHVDVFHREWLLHLPNGRMLAGASHDHDFLEYMGRPFHAVGCIGWTTPLVWSPKDMTKFDSNSVLYVGQVLAVGVEVFPHVLDEIWHEIFGFMIDSFAPISDLSPEDDSRPFDLYEENMYYSESLRARSRQEREYELLAILFMVIGNHVRSCGNTLLDDFCQDRDASTPLTVEPATNDPVRVRNPNGQSFFRSLFHS